MFVQSTFRTTSTHNSCTSLVTYVQKSHCKCIQLVSHTHSTCITYILKENTPAELCCIHYINIVYIETKVDPYLNQSQYRWDPLHVLAPKFMRRLAQVLGTNAVFSEPLRRWASDYLGTIAVLLYSLRRCATDYLGTNAVVLYSVRRWASDY